MADREWMLNPQAIRIAKKCISLVREEFDEKLTLSDPMFMQSLHGYVEISKMRSLGTSYGRLLSMAGVGNVLQALLPKAAMEQEAAEMPTMKMVVGAEVLAGDRIELNGKHYPRWREGKEFSGLYQGQPRYS